MADSARTTPYGIPSFAIDAMNLGSGGAIRHLEELLRAADPTRDQFSRVVVFAPASVALRLPLRDWLVVHVPRVNPRHVVRRELWRLVVLPRRLRAEGVSLVFVPGGIPVLFFRPWASMSQNVLPFSVYRRFAGSWRRRIWLNALRAVQGYGFQRADGVLFLSHYAKSLVSRAKEQGQVRKVVRFGVTDDFRVDVHADQVRSVFRWVYVSPRDFYKRQMEAASACELLLGLTNAQRFSFTFVGAGDFSDVLSQYPSLRDVISSTGHLDSGDLIKILRESDGFVFLSECENLPNTLIEAAVGNLPIVASDRCSHSEILGDSALLVDPSDVRAVAEAMAAIMNDYPHALELAANRAHLQQWTWEQCAAETFDFLHSILR